ncbi:MAG: T9SS type A sorting domain-containing protein [Chitinophagales bacterium]
MKKIYSILFILSITLSAFATTHVVTSSGQTFTPADLTITVGDTVIFNIGSIHDVVEVDEATHDANGTTSNGGFILPSGGDTLTGLTEGIYYYVCTPHASNGMKGTITVEAENSNPTANRNIHIEALNMYPNPAATYTTISFEAQKAEVATIAVYNAIGSKVLAENSNLIVGNNTIDVNVSDLPSGFYFVEVEIAEGRATQRLVVK